MKTNKAKMPIKTPNGYHQDQRRKLHEQEITQQDQHPHSTA